ncbi:MAG TPA: DUF5343 domain-containing protein [Pyrinomonadaceae bacterium]|jgi:hypothetical protein
MAEETKLVAPYVPFSTFETGLNKLAALGGLPPKIDHTVFQQMGGVAKGQVISAFKFLGLIDTDGTPSPLLSQLVLNKDKRKETIRELIKSQYPNITEQDLATMSPSQLDAKLNDEAYNVSGSTKLKARTFLLKAAEFADIPLSKLLTAKGPRGPRTKRAKAANTKQNGNGVKNAPEGETRQEHYVNPDTIRMPISLAPNRVAYVELPKDWSVKDATKLLALLKLSLDVSE